MKTRSEARSCELKPQLTRCLLHRHHLLTTGTTKNPNQSRRVSPSIVRSHADVGAASRWCAVHPRLRLLAGRRLRHVLQTADGAAQLKALDGPRRRPVEGEDLDLRRRGFRSAGHLWGEGRERGEWGGGCWR